MILLTLIARVRDGLILATSIEGGDDVCFSFFLFFSLLFYLLLYFVDRYNGLG